MHPFLNKGIKAFDCWAFWKDVNCCAFWILDRHQKLNKYTTHDVFYNLCNPYIM